MKRFTLAAVAALAVLAPAVGSADTTQTLVYRPELKQIVAVPRQPAEAKNFIGAKSVGEEIARHQAMAQAYRGTRIAQAAEHCDRLVAQLREARANN